MTPERLAALRDLLVELGAPAMVIGGLAVSVRGRPRTTLDADVTIGLGPESVAGVLEAAARHGFVARAEDPEGFVRATHVLPLQRAADGWPVDLVFAGSSYEREALARATPETLSGVSLPFVSAFDLLFHKIVAGRPRDIEDARHILARSDADVDRAALSSLVEQLAEALADDDLRRRAEALLGPRSGEWEPEAHRAQGDAGGDGAPPADGN